MNGYYTIHTGMLQLTELWNYEICKASLTSACFQIWLLFCFQHKSQLVVDFDHCEEALTLVEVKNFIDL